MWPRFWSRAGTGADPPRPRQTPGLAPGSTAQGSTPAWGGVGKKISVVETVTIYCGSGVDFGKISVPVSSTVFNRNCTKSYIYNVRSSIAYKKVIISFVNFLTFVFYFLLDPDPNLDQEQE